MTIGQRMRWNSLPYLTSGAMARNLARKKISDLVDERLDFAARINA